MELFTVEKVSNSDCLGHLRLILGLKSRVVTTWLLLLKVFMFCYSREMKRLGSAVLGAIILAFLIPGASEASATPPKIPFCYQLTMTQYSAPSYSGPTVACSGTHNAVVYAVGSWSVPVGIDVKANALNKQLAQLLSESPYSLSNSQLVAMTSLICQPKAPANPTFNEWAFFLMSPSDYKSGVRTVLCFGAVVDNADKPKMLYNWSGTPFPPAKVSLVSLRSAIGAYVVPGIRAFSKAVTDDGANKSTALVKTDMQNSLNDFALYLKRACGYLDLDGAINQLSVDVKSFMSELSSVSTASQGVKIGTALNNDFGVIGKLLKQYDPKWASSGTPTPSTPAIPSPVESSNGIWSGMADPTGEAGAVGITCDLSNKHATGDFIGCSAYVRARNVSDLPQSLEGKFYAIVNGKVFQSYDPDLNSRTFNPTQWGSWTVDLNLPYGGILTDIYLATSATGSHEFDAPFNVKLSS